MDMVETALLRKDVDLVFQHLDNDFWGTLRSLVLLGEYPQYKGVVAEVYSRIIRMVDSATTVEDEPAPVWGIEIEVLSNSIDPTPGYYHEWEKGSDRSIRRRGYPYGVKLRSPVYGIDDAAEFLEDLRVLDGFAVNKSCGLHVHVWFPQCSPGFNFQLLKLIGVVSCYEGGLYAVTSPRRIKSPYCRPISWARGWYSFWSTVLRLLKSCNYGLNIWSCLYERWYRQTVEFRYFGATLDPVLIVGYVQLAIGLVQRSYELPYLRWSTRDLLNGYSVEQARLDLERLFRFLGWTGNREPAGDLGIYPLDKIVERLREANREFWG